MLILFSVPGVENISQSASSKKAVYLISVLLFEGKLGSLEHFALTSGAQWKALGQNDNALIISMFLTLSCVPVLDSKGLNICF